MYSTRRFFTAVLLLGATNGLGCADRAPEEAGPVPESVERFRVALGEVGGISGVALDADGVPWLLSEDQALLALDLQLRSVRGSIYDIDGLSKKIETESLAWVAPGVFYAGTERNKGERSTDDIVRIEIAGGKARVTETLHLDYEPWGYRAPGNMGIEGLCHANGVLLAAMEGPIERAGERRALLARYTLADRSWSRTTVRLTSATGKLAALDCRAGSGGRIDVLAIERHYGLARLVRFDVPLDGSLPPVDAEVYADLTPLLPSVPNLEGVARLSDGRILLLADNDGSGPDRPNEAILLAPARAKP